jgi:hypothetical protein
MAFLSVFSVVMTSVLALGGESAAKLYFPHYVSASLINLGFIARIEIVLDVLYFILLNIKIIYCLYCVCWGIGYLIKGENGMSRYMRLSVRVCVCGAACLSALIFKSTSEFFVYLSYLRLWGALFFLLPVGLWVAVEIIEKRGRINTEIVGQTVSEEEG